MKKSIRYFLFFLLLVCSACSDNQKIAQNISQASEVNLSSTLLEADGLVTISSPYKVTETSDRLENIIKDKGLTLFTRIDHSANALKAGKELSPTQLLIFGNPKAGTPLMNCSATTAIDLPQKILVVENEAQETQVIYNSPQYLQQRHDIQGCDEVLTKVSGILQGITETAVMQAN